MFIVEGYWSRNNNLVYREIIEDDSLLKAYQDIDTIQYTDGTYLDINVYANGKVTQRLSYSKLIKDCIRQGLTGYIKITDIKD